MATRCASAAPRAVLDLSSLEDLPAEAVRDRETLRQFGLKSNLALPLSVEGNPPVGLLGLGVTQAERDWPEVLVKPLQLVAQIFANALALKRADQALRESSGWMPSPPPHPTTRNHDREKENHFQASADGCDAGIRTTARLVEKKLKCQRRPPGAEGPRWRRSGEV